MLPNTQGRLGVMKKAMDRDWAMGKAAYETYVKVAGDEEAFAWEVLATRLQDAWMEAAHAAHREYEDIA